MATAKEYIEYVIEISGQVQAKNNEIKALVEDAINPRLGVTRPWVTAVVDYPAARLDYLVLKDELTALVALLPDGLDDVPEPIE